MFFAVKKKNIISFIFFFVSVIAFCQNKLPKDSLKNPDFIKKIITYQKSYLFINYNLNYIEWNDSLAIKSFFEKFLKTDKRKLKILHIGDSHIQADLFTGYVRNRLQEKLGKGGRGFVFPYAAAKTHSAYDYTTSSKGKWEFSRNIFSDASFEMGICGASIHTKDSSASFKFSFRKGELDTSFKIIKIYLKKSEQSFNLKLKACNTELPIELNCNEKNNLPYILIHLAQISDTLKFEINKTDTSQNFLECYGMLIESEKENGILYCSVGINGAGYTSILHEKLLPSQLYEFNPDVVIIDLGANDFYKGPFNKDLMAKNLLSIIDTIRKFSQEPLIIITNSQDIYRRRLNIAACKDFSELTRNIAMQKKCAFYDYYNVSGGRYSMRKWLSNKLAKKDKVHLTTEGYCVKGELFVNAILNSYYFYLTGNRIKTDTLIMPQQKAESEKNKTKKNINNSGQHLTHVVSQGETLSEIALKNHVTVKQIMKLNNLKSDKIKPKMVLIIK